MIPNPSKKDFYGVKEHLNGQMCVFSFHVMSADEIRCYLFYSGQCLRFYPSDIINVIPELFENSEDVRTHMIEQMNEKDGKWKKQFDDFKEALQDKWFDHFYYGLVGKSPDIGIPEMKMK